MSVKDVLAGIQYVMEYRIRGSKQPSLDGEMMRKLAEGLMLHMRQSGQRSGLLILLKQKRQIFSEESQLAFQLFIEFIEEVHEFRIVVAAVSCTDLRYALQLHKRVKSADLK